MPSATPSSHLVRLALALLAAFLLGSCAGEAPEVPVGPDGRPDPVLVLGRDVFGSRCSTCHGSDGGGGRGTKLNDGAVIESFPDPFDQAALIADGKAQMPSFFGQLSQAEIDAVVRYTREVLS